MMSISVNEVFRLIITIKKQSKNDQDKIIKILIMLGKLKKISKD